MSVCELLERVASASPVRIDKAAGRIYGVRVLGTQSSNGRTYPESTLRAAVPLYQGVKVFVDHPPRQGGAGDRSYRDQIGVLENARFERGAIYADLAYNPKHPLAEMLVWDAENRPTALGLSHNSMGEVTERNGSRVVEKIASVRSVDVVCSPATNSGLFESRSFTMPRMTPAEFAKELRRRDPEPAIKQTRTETPETSPIPVPRDVRTFVRILRSH